jgi:beta-N-acetylhexosaminidase
MAASQDKLDIGLRFIVEPSSASLSQSEAAVLEQLRPAGVMLRKRNFLQNEPYDIWRSQFSELLADIRAAIGRPNIVVSIDHEGGAVHRFPAPITRFPYPASYGSSPQAVAAVAEAMALELSATGINLSFSPVADIHTNPSNPVINQRAFGTSATPVADAVCLFARTLRQGGVVPCAKHFPGHGDTAVDSHYAVPLVTASHTELEQRELVPFQALIQDGIEMVMSGHVVVPALDAENQATVSPAVLTTLLRESLGFAGVSIADALGMKGIFDVVMSGSFASRAHHAGLDLFLMVGDTVSLTDACIVRDEFQRALDAGIVEPQGMLITQHRIEKFLVNLPQHPVCEIDRAILAKHAELAATLAKNAPFSDFLFSPRGFE